jgi:hypothetical protein
VTIAAGPDVCRAPDDCGAEIVVPTRWHERPLGAPLPQLAPKRVDAATAKAIADWQYWSAMGFRF